MILNNNIVVIVVILNAISTSPELCFVCVRQCVSAAVQCAICTVQCLFCSLFILLCVLCCVVCVRRRCAGFEVSATRMGASLERKRAGWKRSKTEWIIISAKVNTLLNPFTSSITNPFKSLSDDLNSLQLLTSDAVALGHSLAVLAAVGRIGGDQRLLDQRREH